MKKSAIVILSFVLIGVALPQEFTNPVTGANNNSYNPGSFWYYPWGKSVTHKGVDIFASQGTTVKSSTPGIVIYSGEINTGGKVVLVLGPKWRLHYYAHLNRISVSSFSFVSSSAAIGEVGTTGNAKGKSPHLHYAIISLIPYP